jgi:hypothetical protein
VLDIKSDFIIIIIILSYRAHQASKVYILLSVDGCTVTSDNSIRPGYTSEMPIFTLGASHTISSSFFELTLFREVVKAVIYI